MQLSGQEYVDLYAEQGQGAVAEVGRRDGQARRARGRATQLAEAGEQKQAS